MLFRSRRRPVRRSDTVAPLTMVARLALTYAVVAMDVSLSAVAGVTDFGSPVKVGLASGALRPRSLTRLLTSAWAWVWTVGALPARSVTRLVTSAWAWVCTVGALPEIAVSCADCPATRPVTSLWAWVWTVAALPEIAVSCAVRSEERRVGKECQSVCRSRWSPYH